MRKGLRVGAVLLSKELRRWHIAYERGNISLLGRAFVTFISNCSTDCIETSMLGGPFLNFFGEAGD